MDPAPQSHPILSYVLSRLPTLSNPRPASGGGDFDIEQPHVQTSSPRTPSSAGEFDLVERMPGLRHPSVLRAMTRVVAVVSAARSSLQLLGPRPDHELVDSSRALITAAAAGDSQITAFAFSKENWGRPKVEVDFLMRLFERVIHDMSIWQEEDGVSIVNGTWIFLVCLKFGCGDQSVQPKGSSGCVEYVLHTRTIPQSFDPIIEAHTGRDLIPELVKGRRPKDGMPGQDYSGMYCVVLTLGSTVVSAALLRVMGGGVAELPLVATSRDLQGLGYFQALFSCIERMLISLKIEHFMLPAAQEAEAIWMKKFGFSKIPQEQLEAYLNGAHLTIFYGTSNLYKAVPLSQH